MLRFQREYCQSFLQAVPVISWATAVKGPVFVQNPDGSIAPALQLERLRSHQQRRLEPRAEAQGIPPGFQEPSAPGTPRLGATWRKEIQQLAQG